MKDQTGFKVYGYRWVMLLAFMLVVIINQFMWITFASVTGDAAQFYKVSDLAIGLLSMSFMVVYIFVSIPASWVIDKYGIKVAVGIGAILTGIFGLLRGLVPSSYIMVLVSQIGIAIGQPFILNAITKVAARWFPVRERATAAGLGTLAMYFGILLALLITPFIILHTGFGRMLLVYGILSAIFSMGFFFIARERPPTPPCPAEQEERSLMFDGMKQILRQREFIWLMIIFFIGLGVFNAVTTWIEDIVRPRGFSAIQAGISGSLMIAGGVLGALILPFLSDHYRKRVPFIILALGGAILGLTGITFAIPYWLLLLSAFMLGFFLLSAGPIGFQYGAEVTFPAPEGTSNGLLLLMGQISGILFIVAMDTLKSSANGSMTKPLIGLIILMGIGLVLSFSFKESLLMKKEETG
jgi:sugar phosphate permease